MTGRCECGRIRYRVTGEVKEFTHCHCGQCRRSHGAAFASFAGVDREEFSYLSGESDLKTYASSSHQDRRFCGVCGSNLVVVSALQPELLYLALGTADGDPELPEGVHIFFESKAPWYDFTEGSAHFDTRPGDD